MLLRIVAVLFMWGNVWFVLTKPEHTAFYFACMIPWAVMYLGDCIDRLKSGSLDVSVRQPDIKVVSNG